MFRVLSLGGFKRVELCYKGNLRKVAGDREFAFGDVGLRVRSGCASLVGFGFVQRGLATGKRKLENACGERRTAARVRVGGGYLRVLPLPRKTHTRTHTRTQLLLVVAYR